MTADVEPVIIGKHNKPLKHGRTGYVRGCRCQSCIDANREYQRTYMQNWRKSKAETE